MVIGALLVSFGGTVFTWFFTILDPLHWISMHLRNWAPLPDFTGLRWKTQFFTSQLSLAFWVYLLIKSLGTLVLM